MSEVEGDIQVRPLFGALAGDWRQRLAAIVATMREMSRQTEPQAMVRAYGARMREILATDGMLSISRRDLVAPHFRITRFSGWTREVDPWNEKDQLPLLEGGLLGELIYGDEPRIIDDLAGVLDPDDPAAAYLDGFRSLSAIPHYDGGEAINMTLMFRHEPNGFDPEDFPSVVWTSNLFGRATQNLVLSAELIKAYDVVDRELQVVADIQRSLLPTTLPTIPRLDLAAEYRTSKHAGGDYYDIFPLPDDKFGLLVADVSGHGTPAAVLMAITHSLAHAYPGPPSPPGRMLDFVNDRLAARYTSDGSTFVTAFYAIFDPAERTLRYASAGHNPPRLMRCGQPAPEGLDGGRGIPLGILESVGYEEAVVELAPGDQLVFYTDGITEAIDPLGAMYGLDRFDATLARCRGNAAELIRDLLEDLDRFADHQSPADDQTLLVAIVR